MKRTFSRIAELSARIFSGGLPVFLLLFILCSGIVSAGLRLVGEEAYACQYAKAPSLANENQPTEKNASMELEFSGVQLIGEVRFGRNLSRYYSRPSGDGAVFPMMDCSAMPVRLRGGMRFPSGDRLPIPTFFPKAYPVRAGPRC